MGAKRRGKSAPARPKRRASASKGTPRPRTKVRVPPPLPTLGPKKLAARFGVSVRTAAAWIAAGAPASRAADLKKAAGRSRRSKRAAKTMGCRRILLSFGKTAPSYERRGVSGEFFDKERCAVLASAGDGTTLRLQILVGESGRSYPQWADAKKLEGYQNDPELNFAYQGKLQRKNVSRLEIFFPECCGKAARATHEAVQKESEQSYQRTHPEWLKQYRRKSKRKKGKRPKRKAASER